MDFEVKRYNQNLLKDWESLIHKSKNSHFFFSRNYLNYHADRFVDHSIIVYNNNIL